MDKATGGLSLGSLTAIALPTRRGDWTQWLDVVQKSIRSVFFFEYARTSMHFDQVLVLSDPMTPLVQRFLQKEFRGKIYPGFGLNYPVCYLDF
jgi:hypothetical protein